MIYDILAELEDSNTEAMVLAATIKKNFEVVGGMTKLSKLLSDDNEKIQLLVGEIRWSKNLILMAGGKDNLKREFYHAYRDLPKVQPFVAQIGWSHNLYILDRCKYHLISGCEYIVTDVLNINSRFEGCGYEMA
jgi:hypothetical protein